ncbi:MAG TPA: hypothetical protein VKB69_17230 [Micromonosporaceae bacterium]|nr:hypothetical protein [Micromonosporaceae bacterium]
MDAEQQSTDSEPWFPEQQDRGEEPGGGGDGGGKTHGTPRHADTGPESRRSRVVGKRSGLELPDSDPHDDRFPTEVLDRSELRRTATYADAPAGEGTPTSGGPLTPEAAPVYGAGTDAPVYPTGVDTTVPGGVFAPGGLLGPVDGQVATDPAVPGPDTEAGIDGPTMRYAPGHGAPRPLPSGGSIYRPSRPAVAALLALAAGFAEVMVLIKVFIAAAAAHPTNSGGVLGGLLALAAIPMVTMGLYSLATGAATAGGPHVGRAWLRTPLAYLPVGLILLIAAGMAV